MRGVSTSSYADRPATLAVPAVATSVVGSMAAKALWAASSGVFGRSVGETWGVPLSFWASAGDSVWCTADLSWLDQTQTSLPLRMTSDSPDPPTSATRAWLGPLSQTRQVCVPEMTLVRDEPPALDDTPPDP